MQRAASVFGEDDGLGQREAFLDVGDRCQPFGVIRRVPHGFLQIIKNPHSAGFFGLVQVFIEAVCL